MIFLYQINGKIVIRWGGGLHFRPDIQRVRLFLFEPVSAFVQVSEVNSIDKPKALAIKAKFDRRPKKKMHLEW